VLRCLIQQGKGRLLAFFGGGMAPLPPKSAYESVLFWGSGTDTISLLMLLLFLFFVVVVVLVWWTLFKKG